MFIFGLWILVFTTIIMAVGYPSSIPTILLSSIQISIAIVVFWYRVSQNPRLNMIWPKVEPENKKRKIVADKNFLMPVIGRKRRAIAPKIVPKIPRIMGAVMIISAIITLGLLFLNYQVASVSVYLMSSFVLIFLLVYHPRLKVVCIEPPAQLTIACDVANEGITGITVHEVYYRLIKPETKLGAIIPLLETDKKNRKYLKAHEGTPVSFRFPWDKSNLKPGHYKFRIGLYTTKFIKFRDINVKISDDMKTITWW